MSTVEIKPYCCSFYLTGLSSTCRYAAYHLYAANKASRAGQGRVGQGRVKLARRRRAFLKTYYQAFYLTAMQKTKF